MSGGEGGRQDGGRGEQLRYGPMTNDAGTVPLTYDFSIVREAKTDTDTQVSFPGREKFWIFHGPRKYIYIYILHRLCISFDGNFSFFCNDLRRNE